MGDEFVHIWKYGEKFTSMDAMYIYIGGMIVVAFIGLILHVKSCFVVKRLRKEKNTLRMELSLSKDEASSARLKLERLRGQVEGINLKPLDNSSKTLDAKTLNEMTDNYTTSDFMYQKFE